MTTATDRTTLELPGMPSIPGLRARRFADDSDFGRLSAIIDIANQHDEIPYLPTAEQLRLEIDGRSEIIDKRADIVLVEVDGEPVAEAEVWRVLRDETVVYEVGGHVVPAFRRRGIGRALFAENVRRARERAAADEARGLAVELGGFADEGDIGTVTLLETEGFDVVRHFFLMRRGDLAAVAEPTLPEGLEIRPVEADQYGRSSRPRQRPSATTGAIASRPRRTTSSPSSTRPSTRASGPSPGMATRSPGSCRSGSGPKRTRSSAYREAGSSGSASAVRGAAAGSAVR